MRSGQFPMRIVRAALLVMTLSAVAMGQSSAPAPMACKKTITFAIAAGGQPVPAIPKFASKWFGKTKRVQSYADLCFSQTPSPNTVNYLVIFSDGEAGFDGLVPSVHTYTSAGPLSGNVAGVSGYGGTWNFSYTGKLPENSTTTVDLQRVDTATSNFVIRAYNQQGREIGHYMLAGWLTKEKLLDNVLSGIERDQVEPSSPKKVAVPLSVYYVNCDTDSTQPTLPTVTPLSPTAPKPGLADGALASAVVPAPKPRPTLEFASNPPGADIYLDGAYVGKTPFRITVEPGMHRLVISKQDFSTWQQKVEVSSAGRKISAYLERRFLLLQ